MSVGNTIRMYAEYDFSFTEFTVQVSSMMVEVARFTLLKHIMI